MYAAAPITALLLLVQGIEPEAADGHPAPQAVTTVVPRAGDIPDVAPILAAHCFACHGPDASARKAGLRLDRRDGAIRVSAKGRAAIVPGDPDASAAATSATCSSDSSERLMPTVTVLAWCLIASTGRVSSSIARVSAAVRSSITTPGVATVPVTR